MTVDGRRPTQRDVALISGVSQSTVSAILAGRAKERGVAASTQDAVLKVANELGYHFDTTARRLKGKSGTVIGVHTYGDLFPLMYTNYNYEYLVGAHLAAEAAGYDMLLFTSSARAERKPSVFAGDANRLRAADGSVILGYRRDHDELRRLAKEGYPFVRIGRRDLPGQPIAWVDGEFSQGTYELVRALLDAGYANPVYLGRPQAVESFADRHAGFLRAAEEFGLPAPCSAIIAREKVTAAWVRSMVRRGARTVIADDHVYAARVVDAVTAAGLRIDIDVFVAVLQAPYASAYERPYCGYLVEPRVEVGRQAATVLIEMLEGRPPADLGLRIPTQPLVVRPAPWSGSES